MPRTRKQNSEPSKSVKITLPDGTSREFKKGITALEIAESIGPRLAKDALGAEVNGKLKDIFVSINEDSGIKILTWKDKEGVEVFRHSSAHLLAHAVTELFPKAKPTIGPVVEEGFYYDFDIEHGFTPEDLEKIEKRTQEIVEKNYKVERIELSEADAKKLFRGNQYKIEIIEETAAKGESLSAYRQGNFTDLCRGPHIISTGLIKGIKLTKVAGAYWRGDSKNKQLQRIYGISFPDKKELDDYLRRIEEAEKRDHKKIGREMELFMTSESVGKGLPIWLPKGEIIKREIENFAIKTEAEAGYQRVATPHLAKKELYIQSGHLPYYKDSMYPEMQLDDGNYYLKAMNCPHHHIIFGHKSRSYRELPLRISEYGVCYRNELSGTLSGLLRVRMLSMNDAHIYCSKEQIESEFENVLNLIVKYYNTFGLKDYYFRLSLGDTSNKEKYVDEPANWEFSQSVLRKVLKKLNVKFVESNGEAAFYGPKVDIQYKTVIGREETISTIQLDFIAKKRFGLKYADKDGKENNEVYVIHRAPLSTHERFMAFLIEHYAGKFPLWLSPVQIKVLTVADRFSKYAEEIKNIFEKEGARIEVDARTESVSYKVRDAQNQRIPLIVTIGEKEEQSKTLAVRTHNKVHFGVKIDDLLGKVVENIKNKEKEFEI